MAVLKFREAAGKATMWRAVEPGCMSAELTEDDGAPTASLPQLPAPETITTSDLAAKLAGADAAISNLQLRTRHNELRRALKDLQRDRDEWRRRAERLAERPWWRWLAG
jgi:hypothetical protein